MRTRAWRMGPRSSSATPVLADAGTAVAVRAGRAVRAAACAEARGRGVVGTPAWAARAARGGGRPRGGEGGGAGLGGAAAAGRVRRQAGSRASEVIDGAHGVDPSA